MNRRLIYIAAFVITVLLSCKKIYNPQLTTVSTNILAIDGPIISGDSTFIRLSRSTNLSDTTQNKAELKATVSVESDQNTLYPLVEKGKGLYVLGVTNFDAAHKYRLNVKTSNGKIYQSDFVPLKKTPPVDSVYFENKGVNQVIFYLNTHDATNSTRYYRWDYTETWRYVSLFKYYYVYKNGTVDYIGPNDLDISTCYRTATSNEIFVGSSIKNNDDVIFKQQLGGLVSSEKIVRGYVMRVKQYALTKEGFEYYQNLKTSTEQLGSIFDAQPTFLKGNIHCISNPSENVIGFVSVSTTSFKQISLNYQQIPFWYTDYYGLIEWTKGHSYAPNTPLRPSPEDCPVDGLIIIPAGSTFQKQADSLLNHGKIIFDEDFNPVLNKPVYFYASKECVDCRTQGGTTTKPSYFPF